MSLASDTDALPAHYSIGDTTSRAWPRVAVGERSAL
jgi:hypothetical protein